MGQTLQKLSSKDIEERSIFNNRFVVEICESVHIHYRNLRLNLSVLDFENFASGCKDAYERWVKRGKKMDGKTHLELCRKRVGQHTKSEGVKVNLNKNLYNEYKDQIFSEGADFTEPEYIHLKIRDMRIEMSKEEFKQLAEAVKEADEKLRSPDPVLQET